MLSIVRQLQEHESQYFSRMKPPDEIGPWYIESIKLDTRRHKGRIIVAEIGGAIAGYATLLTEVTSDEEIDEVHYTYSSVGDLAVATSHRGKGVGRKLLEDCERQARAAGQKWLRLSVLAGNHGARRFYDAFEMDEMLLTLEKRLT